MAIILFQLYRLVKGSLAYNIFIGLLLIYLLSLIAKALDMQLMGEILGQFIGIGVLALLVVFQPEVRRFLLYVGRSSDFRKFEFWRRLSSSAVKGNTLYMKETEEILLALKKLSQSGAGALLVFPATSKLQTFQNSGVILNAEIQAQLIESVFQKHSPLHDGAMIIVNHKIAAAKCILNVSENPNLPVELGLRHRSAVGITEVSDALAIILSEENGEISSAKGGNIKQQLSFSELQKMISNALLQSIN